MILLLLACRPDTDAPAPGPPFDYGTPAITDLDWSCSEEDAEWEFTVRTDAWTSNGELWMAEGELAEKHSIPSIGAEADGSGDKLRLRLGPYKRCAGTFDALSSLVALGPLRGRQHLQHQQQSIESCKGATFQRDRDRVSA